MHELGLGLPLPRWLAGLMRKPIRKKAVEEGGERGRGREAAVKTQLFSY